MTCVPPVMEEEDCFDHLDNDWDNLVNEDCSCTPDEKTICYLGPKQTEGVGVCVDVGILTCGKDGKYLGNCQGQTIFVAKETGIALCRNGKDDDCDGRTDGEDLECASFLP